MPPLSPVGCPTPLPAVQCPPPIPLPVQLYWRNNAVGQTSFLTRMREGSRMNLDVSSRTSGGIVAENRATCIPSGGSPPPPAPAELGAGWALPCKNGPELPSEPPKPTPSAQGYAGKQGGLGTPSADPVLVRCVAKGGRCIGYKLDPWADILRAFKALNVRESQQQKKGGKRKRYCARH